MSNNQPAQPPTLDQLYRQHQQASNVQGNIVEILLKTCENQNTEIVTLRERIILLEAEKKRPNPLDKIKDLEVIAPKNKTNT